jgi:hypothetical protein
MYSRVIFRNVWEIIVDCFEFTSMEMYPCPIFPFVHKSISFLMKLHLCREIKQPIKIEGWGSLLLRPSVVA